MLDLLDKLDYDATAKRVDYYLTVIVARLLRIANESPAALKSPNMDGMPRCPHYENVNETKMQKYIDAKTEINAVGMVIMRCSLSLRIFPSIVNIPMRQRKCIQNLLRKSMKVA